MNVKIKCYLHPLRMCNNGHIQQMSQSVLRSPTNHIESH